MNDMATKTDAELAALYETDGDDVRALAEIGRRINAKDFNTLAEIDALDNYLEAHAGAVA